MAFGVTDLGFAKKTLSTVLEEIVAAEQATISPTINTLPTSVLGQLNGIFADQIAQLWDVAQAVYASQFPDSATGLSLDYVAALTGATRSPASHSIVTLSLNLQPGVTVQQNAVVSIGSTGARFFTATDISNTTAYPLNVDVLAYSVDYGPIVGISGAINTIQTPVTGWSAKAAIDIPNTEPYAITNGMTLLLKVDGGGTQTITFLTGDTSSALVAARIDAGTTGMTVIDVDTTVRLESDSDNSTSVLEILSTGTANAVLGFSTTASTLKQGFNALDAALGDDLETDTSLRARRESLLSATGNATLESIRADVEAVANVIAVLVLENETDSPVAIDGSTLPAHSIEVVVDDSISTTEQNLALATAIFNTKAAGIQTYATSGQDVTVSVTDSQGFTHDISFTRAATLAVYVDARVLVDLTTFGGDANAARAAVKAAIVAEGDLLNMGDDAIIARIQSAVFNVLGVTDLNTTPIKMDVVNPPLATTNLTVGMRERADFDTSRTRVSINSDSLA